jgi:hypothetical protein
MAVHPYSAALFVDQNSDTVFTEVTEVVSIAPPITKVGKAESTVLKSTGATRTSIPGFIDEDQFSFVLRFTSSSVAINYAFFRALLRLIFPWRIVLPLETGQATAGQLDFDGWIMENGIEEFTAEGDECIDMTCTACITGPMDFTPAT